MTPATEHNNAPAVPQGWVEQMLTDARYVFDAGGPETHQETRDVIEYIASWIAAYRDKFSATQPASDQAVPSGWKLVPVEPTKEMLDAVSWANCAKIDWHHMLDAAPAPPATEPAAPAQEVVLTDEEIEAIAKKHMSTVGDHWCNEDAIRERHAEDFARAIISALRAKGGKL